MAAHSQIRMRVALPRAFWCVHIPKRVYFYCNIQWTFWMDVSWTLTDLLGYCYAYMYYLSPLVVYQSVAAPCSVTNNKRRHRFAPASCGQEAEDVSIGPLNNW